MTAGQIDKLNMDAPKNTPRYNRWTKKLTKEIQASIPTKHRNNRARLEGKETVYTNNNNNYANYPLKTIVVQLNCFSQPRMALRNLWWLAIEG